MKLSPVVGVALVATMGTITIAFLIVALTGWADDASTINNVSWATVQVNLKKMAKSADEFDPPTGIELKDEWDTSAWEGLRCVFAAKVDGKDPSKAKAGGDCQKYKDAYKNALDGQSIKKCDDLKVEKEKDECKRNRARWPANQFVFASVILTLFFTLALIGAGIAMFTSASMNTAMLKIFAISLSAAALVFSWLGWIVYLAVTYSSESKDLKDKNMDDYTRVRLSVGWALYFVASLIYIPWLVIHLLNSTSQSQ